MSFCTISSSFLPKFGPNLELTSPFLGIEVTTAPGEVLVHNAPGFGWFKACSQQPAEGKSSCAVDAAMAVYSALEKCRLLLTKVSLFGIMYD